MARTTRKNKFDLKTLAIVFSALAAFATATTPVTLKVLDIIEKNNIVKYGFRPEK
jgi:hypothetical protein